MLFLLLPWELIACFLSLRDSSYCILYKITASLSAAMRLRVTNFFFHFINVNEAMEGAAANLVGTTQQSLKTTCHSERGRRNRRNFFAVSSSCLSIRASIKTPKQVVVGVLFECIRRKGSLLLGVSQFVAAALMMMMMKSVS